MLAAPALVIKKRHRQILEFLALVAFGCVLIVFVPELLGAIERRKGLAVFCGGSILFFSLLDGLF